MPTLNELAEKVGYSVSTIKKALRNGFIERGPDGHFDVRRGGCGAHARSAGGAARAASRRRRSQSKRN